MSTATSWAALEAHRQSLAGTHLRELFQRDPGRVAAQRRDQSLGVVGGEAAVSGSLTGYRDQARGPGGVVASRNHLGRCNRIGRGTDVGDESFPCGARAVGVPFDVASLSSR